MNHGLITEMCKIVSRFQNIQIGSGAHPTFALWLSGAVYPRVKQTRHEADSLPPSGAKVHNEWRYTFIDCTWTTSPVE